MCDYSLMVVPNRLAREGEELVAHQFLDRISGSCLTADLRRAACPRPVARSFWSALKEFFNPPKPEPVPAVCIPPGARLQLQGIPVRLQREFGVGPWKT
jgi:hypothetical protein